MTLTTPMTTTRTKKMTAFEGVVNTLDFSKGQGAAESLIAFAFIIGYFMLLLLDKQVPEAVTAIMTIIVSVFFSVHATQNAPKEKKK